MMKNYILIKFALMWAIAFILFMLKVGHICTFSWWWVITPIILSFVHVTIGNKKF